VAKKSVGKSIPFSMFKVKKPDNFEEIIKRVEEERIKQRVKKFFTKSKQFKNNIISFMKMLFWSIFLENILRHIYLVINKS